MRGALGALFRATTVTARIAVNPSAVRYCFPPCPTYWMAGSHLARMEAWSKHAGRVVAWYQGAAGLRVPPPPLFVMGSFVRVEIITVDYRRTLPAMVRLLEFMVGDLRGS